MRRRLIIALVVCVAAIGALCLSRWIETPRFAADILAASGPPLAVAQSAELGRRSWKLHSQELRLSGLRAFGGEADDRRGTVWVFSDDSRLQLHLYSLLRGQFADLSGKVPFAYSPSFVARMVEFDEHGQVVKDWNPRAYFLLVERCEP